MAASLPVRILGIDPGLQRTGWGIIACDGPRLTHVACGTLRTLAAAPLCERLAVLFAGLEAIIAAHVPHEAAVECTFVNRDGAATLKLGQARGIALLAPARAGLSVAEYAPNLVKKSVVGSGHADKTQVTLMVRRLLPLAGPDSADAADALAIAITHAHHRMHAARMNKIVAAAVG